MGKVTLPTCFIATASTKSPTSFKVTLRLALIDSYNPAASLGSTPIILILGSKFLMYAPMPAIKPPPPTGTNTASIFLSHSSRISLPIVP